MLTCPPRALRRVLVFIALTAFIFIASCTAVNRLPGYAYFRLNSDPTTLDPALVVDVAGGAIAAKLFNGLVRLGDDLSVVPDIAHRWSISDDGLTYRFYLIEGVRFANGRTVTAGDFKYSIERVLDPTTRSPRTWLFDYVTGAKEFNQGEADEVRGIKVINPLLLEIRLTQPFAPFLGLLTMTNAYVVPEEEVLRLGPDFSSSPVGTGPYTIEHWQPSQQVVLRARGDYFGSKPRLPGIVYRVIPEDLTAVAEFEIGNLDVMSVPVSEYSRYRKSEKWKDLIDMATGLNTYYLGLNYSKPPFNNLELRRAVAHAIDKNRILATLMEGRGTAANGPVPPVLRRWPAPAELKYDPQMARDVIEKLPPASREIEFYITGDPQTADIAEVIQSYLNDAGFKVRIRPLEWSAFKAAVNNGEADMFWLSWWADYPDAENFLFPLFHSSNLGPGGNRVRYVNPQVDALIDAGGRESQETERNRLYASAEAMIASEAPWVFFWHKTEVTIRQAWVSDYRQYPVYSMDKGLDIMLADR